MKFNKKKVLTISGIVLGVIVVLLVIVYFSLSLILKSSVQTFGSMVMGVPVTVDSIVLEPFKGALRINNLTVGNPDGYSSPHAFKLGRFEAAVVPSSLFGGDKMIIDKLAIDGVELNMETNFLRSNLSEIQENINKFSNPDSNAPKNQKQAEDVEKVQEEQAEAKPLQINRIDLSDIKVYTILKGREDTRVIPLIAPPVHLQDLGTEPEGITPVEVMSKVMTSLLLSAGKALSDGAFSAGQTLGDGASSAGKTLGDGANDLGKAPAGLLKGLTGSDEKEKKK